MKRDGLLSVCMLTCGLAFHVEDSNPNPSFYVESMDSSMHEGGVIQGVTPPPDRYSVGAPSRPPSRSNAKSPLGRMVDMTASDVPSTYSGASVCAELIHGRIRRSTRPRHVEPRHGAGFARIGPRSWNSGFQSRIGSSGKLHLYTTLWTGHENTI